MKTFLAAFAAFHEIRPLTDFFQSKHYIEEEYWSLLKKGKQTAIRTFVKLYRNFSAQVKKNQDLLLKIDLETSHEQVKETISQDHWLTDTIEIVINSLDR